MTEQAEQQVVQEQVTPATAIPEDAPPAPVDVDIDAGTVTQVEPQEVKTETPAPAQRTKPRPQARIQNLTHERDAERAERQRLEQELAQMRAYAVEQQAAREQAERVGMENHVARTKSEVAAAEAALLQAKESQDAAAEIAAQKRLARAVAEEADADAWVKGQPKQQEQQQQQQQRQQQQQQQQQQRPQEALPSPQTRDFLAENRWFDAFERATDGSFARDPRTGQPMPNPDFDQDMHDAAMIEHKRISREIRMGILPEDYIESEGYFDRIRTKIRSEFSDAFEPEEAPAQAPRAKTPQMGAPKQSVAPSQRQVPQQQAQQRQGQKLRLDGEQAELVRSLVDNNTMRYPHNHPDPAKRGQKMSYDDAYLKYARELQADQASRSGNNQQ